MHDSSVLRDRPVLSEGVAAPLALDADRVGRIDILTAGYPCQPFSTAARGRNNATDLWPEALRIIRCVRPCWVVLENVPGVGLAHIDRSCSELEAIDYAVWPLDIGVEVRNHVRRRIWVVAHDNRQGEPQLPVNAEVAGVREAARRWRCEPEPMGVDDGFPDRMDRMRALGNSIEPAIAELLIRAVCK
jgi:DNA (cytosine-5)-methyltransferase 1